MSNQTVKQGYFVISLDFELMWGMFDKTNVEKYGDTLRGVPLAVPRILELFTRYDIHATWATVGMLASYHIMDMENMTPLDHERPRYLRPELSAYHYCKNAKSDFTDNLDLYFAPELLERIKTTPNQEIASHTFSHFYCLEDFEPGHDRDAAFTADALAVQKTFSRFDINPTSIVFPRNQWTDAALNVLRRLGYKAYRGNQKHFLYRARKDIEQNNLIIRVLRLIDTYLNISGHHTYKLNKVNKAKAELLNIPASRFLRPYNKRLKVIESLRLRRIKRGMTRAAKRGEVFHLWWHPHNFGLNQNENFKMLEAILQHYKELKKRYPFTSASMAEVAKAYHE